MSKKITKYELLCEILDIQRVLKNHGEAHDATDLTPQFRELCKKVERMDLEPCFNFGALEHHTARILELEQHQGRDRADLMSEITALKSTTAMQAHTIAGILKRLNALDMQVPSKRIDDLEREIKDQREDYHDHIRQLVEENEAAHAALKHTNGVARECSNLQAAEILKMAAQINVLETRLSQAYDLIATKGRRSV